MTVDIAGASAGWRHERTPKKRRNKEWDINPPLILMLDFSKMLSCVFLSIGCLPDIPGNRNIGRGLTRSTKMLLMYMYMYKPFCYTFRFRFRLLYLTYKRRNLRRNSSKKHTEGKDILTVIGIINKLLKHGVNAKRGLSRRSSDSRVLNGFLAFLSFNLGYLC